MAVGISLLFYFLFGSACSQMYGSTRAMSFCSHMHGEAPIFFTPQGENNTVENPPSRYFICPLLNQVLQGNASNSHNQGLDKQNLTSIIHLFPDEPLQLNIKIHVQVNNIMLQEK